MNSLRTLSIVGSASSTNLLPILLAFFFPFLLALSSAALLQLSLSFSLSVVVEAVVSCKSCQESHKSCPSLSRDQSSIAARICRIQIDRSMRSKIAKNVAISLVTCGMRHALTNCAGGDKIRRGKAKIQKKEKPIVTILRHNRQTEKIVENYWRKLAPSLSLSTLIAALFS